MQWLERGLGFPAVCHSVFGPADRLGESPEKNKVIQNVKHIVNINRRWDNKQL
jgi:hypothetical protein